MSSVERAVEVLKQAEVGLRDIVAQAVAVGDYGSVVQIASWAGAVRDLVGREAADDSKRPPSPPPKKKASASIPARSGRTHRRQGKDGYPRFFRQGDQLIRVAWSKRDKKEYQHKAPYSTIQLLAEAMAKAGRDGRVFSTDQILPIKDADGNDVPSYQAYVGIAFMKQVGLIDQHGRQGYSIPQLADFQANVESAWRNLPTS
jgi:hypothetical protein